MTGFRFPLQRVLDWRKTQMELEEAQYRRQLEALADMDRQSADLARAGDQAERQVRAWNPLAGSELEALGGFRLHVRQQQEALAVSRAERNRLVTRQRELMLEARRRVRLLERLKETRLTEWHGQQDKELEELASESYLAKWQKAGVREASRPYNEEHDP